MALVRWQPWQEMETVRRQMDQLFDELFSVQDAPLATGKRGAWAPAIELKTADTEVVLRAELPGIDAKDLDVQVTREAVSISGEYKAETKTEEGRIVRSELRYGKFYRVIPLPFKVQNDQVKAEFQDGILTLVLPKLQAKLPKVVKVNLDNTQPLPAPQPAAETTPTTTEQPEMGDVWTEAA